MSQIVDYKLADVGEGIAEAEVIEWLVAVGDLVSEDQPVVVVETDKSQIEIPAPVSGKVIELASGKKYHIGNPLNDLTGSQWTHFLRSVFSSRYPTSGKESYGHKIRKIHPSPKPPQLMRELIEFFTKENEFISHSHSHERHESVGL